MGAMFRSEEMALIQVFIQPETAYHVVSELGEAGCVQFRDLNQDINLFQREFATEIKRCDEMERQIRYIEEQIKKHDVPMLQMTDIPKAPNPRDIAVLEGHLEKSERDIRELTQGATKLKQKEVELKEKKIVLDKAQIFYNQKEDIVSSEYTEEDKKNAAQLGFISGIINKDKVFSFERMLFRVGRGNIFIRQDDIEEDMEDPVTGLIHRKCAFIAFYQGENLDFRIKKIATAFHAKIIECPASLSERVEKNKKLSTELEDIKKVLNKSNDLIRSVLGAVGKDIQNWSVMVRKMKAIYHTLNLFSLDVSKKCLIAEGWVPTGDLNKIQEALTAATTMYQSPVPSFLNILNTNEIPPTFNRTNKFTRGFQNLISSYGFANYRELNPALYTIISFPFLFAIMFGDFGHAIIMTLFGSWLVISEKKIAAQKNKGEIFSIFFGGRYIILLMGLFSMYTGFLYNDIFSKSMNIFGTKWRMNPEYLTPNFTHYNETEETMDFDILPRGSYAGDPYLLGIDPIWQAATNKIIFLNSFKMKLSIVIGVIHMLFGIVLSTLNHIHFKRYSALFLDFLPKLFFFLFLFIYLAVMIFMKWCMYSGTYDGKTDNDTSSNVDTTHGSSCAPSVLIYFIGMMLLKKTDATENCEAYMYKGQEQIQHVLLVAALLCVPMLLMGTPIYGIIKKKKKPVVVQHHENGHVHPRHKTSHASRLSMSHQHNIENLESIPENSELQLHEEEPLSDILVHQAIETIEFTLSTVSHTASYLRLWALSLAHSQLSDVLWSMVFRKALIRDMGYAGSALVFVFFVPWAFCTVGILVLMEGLSAFLHTLRLHWVEFMSKFYKGEGYDFLPFSFKTLTEEDE